MRKDNAEYKWRGQSMLKVVTQKKMSDRDEGSSSDSCNDSDIHSK